MQHSQLFAGLKWNARTILLDVILRNEKRPAFRAKALELLEIERACQERFYGPSCV